MPPGTELSDVGRIEHHNLFFGNGIARVLTALAILSRENRRPLVTRHSPLGQRSGAKCANLHNAAGLTD